MSFLSSLVSSPSAAKAAAKNLWPTGLSPPAEAKLQSTMADGEFGLFPRCVSAAKGKVRNTEYMRHYRQQHPDYVRRNAALVRKWRQQLRQEFVSHTSRDLHVTIESERTSLRIAHVSHTSRDIVLTLETS